MFYIKGGIKINRRLFTITQALLSNDADLGAIKLAIDEYYNLLIESLGFDEYKDQHKQSINTKYGRAISPFEAAHCVKEFLRTRQFICGVVEAIRDQKQKYPDEIIKILYAGTGPFGALMLPVTTLFSAEEIQFTLMEINPISMNFLKNTIEHFDISDYIDEYIMADATSYQLINKGTHHILLTETMQQALRNEPQVAICLNLMPQISPEAVLIPSSIQIDLVLLNQSNNHRRKMGEMVDEIFSPIVKIIDFNKEKINEILSSVAYINGASSFHCARANIAPYTNEEEALALLTNIEVYSSYKLSLDECSLNMPVIIKEDETIRRRGHQLTFDYILSDRPSFRWKEHEKNE